MPPSLLEPFVRALLLLLFWGPGGPGGLGASDTDTEPSSPAGDNELSAAGTEAASAEPPFIMQVLLRDSVSRAPLSGASVDLYVNHSLRSSVLTGPRGDVLLWVTYTPAESLTLVGRMEGYLPMPLPWSAARRPLFSALTLALLPQSQGNLWLYEDSVLISRKLPDSSSQPRVKFPKNLISGTTNVSSVSAYLTVPQRPLAKDCGNCTLGIISSKSALRSLDLRPVAAVSVLLYSGEEQLQIRGPIHISLPLGPNTRLRAADTVPAWAFNSKTGAWENQGLGIVKSVGSELVWTYTASHLGYWLAAPLPSSRDYIGLSSSLPFLPHHKYLLMGILAGTLAIVVGLLSVLLCYCRGSDRAPRRRARFSKLTVVKKDQTTSTHLEEGLLSCDPSSTPRHKVNYNIYVEEPLGPSGTPLYENIKPPQPLSHYINSDEVARLRNKAEQNRANMNSEDFFPDKLVHLYNQPVALIQAPELFSAQDLGCKAATFPRNGLDEAESKSHTQTLPKGGGSPQQSSQDDPQSLDVPVTGTGPNANASWSRYSNLESSVSVPGTLNEAFGGGPGDHSELQGISERTLLELTRGKTSVPLPRAWFVSLDGRPAAQVRHSIIALQGRTRPSSSNDTSLDSGVDMNEPQHRPSVKTSSLSHLGRGRYGDEQDLSSSESGTTTTCTPEEPSLRNILDGCSITNIPEERDGMDTSSAQEDSESRGTPPPRRLRKVREKGKSVKRGPKHVREARAFNKRS
ncbi:protein FAM171B [Eucyclogobius newberryi]|uniref:protein FAM171B n=1 Tax=Eucyclogobius newberryi TaxID=166745 RepID=UPI003B5A5FC1